MISVIFGHLHSENTKWQTLEINDSYVLCPILSSLRKSSDTMLLYESSLVVLVPFLLAVAKYTTQTT